MTKPVKSSAAAIPTTEKICVLVLGMHRSGTSALSRVLNLLGCDLPKTLMAAHPSNEAGHWESLPIARLNDEILNSAGSNWHDWLSFNPGWHSSPRAAEFKEKALAVLTEEFGQSRLFVLKDPRICRIAPFWLDVLETARVRPTVIMPVRNPLEVAASIFERDGIEPALGHLIWLRHLLEAEAGSRGLPRFHTSYEALLTSWSRLAAGAQDKLGISWPRLSPMASEEIDAFLTDRLRHHREQPRSVSDNPLLSAWLREAFAIFSRWADEGETAEDHAALDRIRAQLDGAGPAFARLISTGQYSVRKVKSLDANLKEAQDKLSEAEAAAAAQQQAVETLEQQLKDTRTALSASEASAEQKEREIAEAAGRLATARSHLEELQAETHSLRTTLEETRGELSHSQSELAQRRAEADDATAELRQAQQRHAEELQAERANLAARYDEIASLTRLLQDKEAETAAALASKREEADRAARLASELQAERNRASDEAQKLRQEKDTAEGRLAERFGEIASLTRLLQDKEAETAAALASKREEADRAARLASELQAERNRASDEAQKLRQEKDTAEGRLAERFGEIATMTRLLGEREDTARASDEQVAWLREVSAVLLNGSTSNSLKGRLAALLPVPIRLKKQKARLQRAGMFDPDAYLAAHPDVAEAGLDPLWHYINHGMAEGRQLQPTQESKDQ